MTFRMALSKLLTVVLGVPIILVACDLVDPVDPTVNDSAHPPSIAVLDIHEIQHGQHLAGEFDISFDIDSTVGPVDMIALIVDDSIVDRSSPLRLITTDFPEGEHIVAIALRETDHDIGLLGITGSPTVFYAAEVIFDQTPPTPVVLDSAVWDNQSPRLYWQQNADANFYAYTIERTGNISVDEPDSVFDRTTTTIRDTAIHTVYGIDMNYRVQVTNRAEFSESNIVNIRYGDTLPMDFQVNSSWNEPISNPTHDIVYCIKDSSFNTIINAFSTQDNSLIGSAKTRYWTEALTVSKDGSRFYAMWKDTIIVYDGTNMDVLDSLYLSPGVGFTGHTSRMAVGRDDRLYISTGKSGDSGTVKIVDTYTGATKGETVLGTNNGLLIVSPDNNTLYVAHRGSPPVLYRLDISIDSAQIVTSKVLTDNGIEAWQLSSDGNFLYVVQSSSMTVNVHDALTLDIVNQIQAPILYQDDDIWAILVTNSHIYISVSTYRPGYSYYLTGNVYMLDRSDLTELQEWSFVMVPHFLAVSSGEEFLYALGRQPWVVDMR